MKSTILKITLFIALFGALMYSCEQSAARQDQYAIEHNCKYDYNGLCYTKEQRPWLFK